METLFSLAGVIVMPAWLALILLPFRWPRAAQVIQLSVPVVLGIGYTVLFVLFWGERTGGYDSLAAVRSLFSHDALLLAGWVHYLAFDLFVGAWIVERAHRLGLHHAWTLPCLPLTFLFGPVGLLLYLLIESGWRFSAARREVTV